MVPPHRLSGFLLLVFLLLSPSLAGTGRGELLVMFLVDRSGSMWAPMGGTPRTVLLADALTAVTRDLPPEVAVGLRVYPPPPATEGFTDDPGLRVPLGTGNRDLFPEELQRLNPRGRALLAEHLQEALKDFPRTQDSKLLILINDNADTNGHPFCGRPGFSNLPEALQLNIFTLNLQDESEREELNCLSRQFAGSIVHLDPGDSLRDKLLKVTRNAHEEETARQARLLEEKRRQEALRSKTRLQVSFRNTLDPFFADSLEVVDFRINGRKIPLEPPIQVVRGEQAVVHEEPAAAGLHRVELQYRMWRGRHSLVSRTGSLEMEVEEGTTSRVLAVPRSALFHWGCSLKPLPP